MATVVKIPFQNAARKALAILAAGACLSMAATIVCLALGIHNGLDPADVPALRDLFPSLRISYFVPEPLERAQAVGFIAGAYMMSIALILLPRLDHMIPSKAAQLFWILFVTGSVGVLVFGEDAFQIPVRLYATLKSLWLPENPVLWLATFLVAVSPVLAKSTRWGQRMNRFLAVMGVLGLVLLCARVSFLEPQYGLTVDKSNLHNSAALHSVMQASFGQVPYLDFVPQYGGYGLFALPFFRLGLDPWIALCLFLFFCYVVTFGAIVAAVGLSAKSWIAGSYAGVVAFWLSSDFRTALSYFQGFPLRTFFPALLLLLISIYPRHPKLISITSGFMMPLAMYWNPETGLVCLGAAVSFLIFDAATQRHAGGLVSNVRMVTPLLFFLSLLVATVFFYAVIFLVFSHTPPLADLLFHGMVFSRFGYFNLPIPLLDVWVPAACAFCLLLSFPGSSSSLRSRTLFGFFCAMLFSGLFFYYQGRSYTGNLVGFAFPIACGLFAWLWSDFKYCGSSEMTARYAVSSEHRGSAHIFRFSIAGRDVVVFAFAIASAALAGSSFISAPLLNPFSMAISAEDRTLHAFIRNESKGYQAAFIVSPQAWRLHLLSGVAPPKNATPDAGLISRLQEEETIRAVDPESGYALFVDSNYFSQKGSSGSRFHTILAARIESQWQRGASLRLHSGDLTVFKPRARSERRTAQ